MAVINVNPTRMELSALKKKLAVARKGHKLLKDKRDEMMRQFLDIVKDNKKLRVKVEDELKNAEREIVMAKSVMGNEKLKTALMLPKISAEVTISDKNIMSVDIPQFSLDETQSEPALPYGYADTSGILDDGIKSLSLALPSLIMLAQQENAAQLLAVEIEKTRRRVNALEHVMIPNYSDTIKFISMKLDENERATTTRLMKVKDMMLEERIEQEKTDN